MSGGFEQAHQIAGELVDYLQRNHFVDPMQATASVAIALGSMVQSLNELGMTKQGQSGKLLAHLFELAEQTAVTGASA